MKPELEKLQKEIDDLRKELTEFKRLFEHAPAYTPDMTMALGKVVLSGSDADPADYDRAVDEDGTGTYNVMSVCNGFKQDTDGNLIPYYTP